MNKRLLGLGLILLITIGCPMIAATAPGAKVALAYRPVLNDRRTLNLTVDTAVTQSVAGYQVVRRQTAAFQLECQVVQVDSAGQAVVKVLFQNIRVSLHTPLETLEFASDQPASAPVANVQPVLALTGRWFTVRLNPKEALSDGKLDRGIRNADPFAVNRVMVWNDSIAAFVAGVFNIPRPGPVGIDESWKKNLVLPSEDCPIPVELGLQLAETKSGLGLVNLFGTVKHSVKNSVNIKSNPKAAITVDQLSSLVGTTRGELAYGLQDGWVERADVVTSLVGEVRRGETAIPLRVELKIRLRATPR